MGGLTRDIVPLVVVIFANVYGHVEKVPVFAPGFEKASFCSNRILPTLYIDRLCSLLNVRGY